MDLKNHVLVKKLVLSVKLVFIQTKFKSQNKILMINRLRNFSNFVYGTNLNKKIFLKKYKNAKYLSAYFKRF